MLSLPPALARVLRDTGCDVLRCGKIGLRDATDSEIWHYAIQRGAAIITKDDDFAERCLHSQNQPVIVWLRIGNTSNRAFLIGPLTRGFMNGRWVQSQAVSRFAAGTQKEGACTP
jgi:predicted nuclease of predicted toxin-antitoxin system